MSCAIVSEANGANFDIIANVPREIAIRVFNYLLDEPKYIGMCMQVCTLLKNLVDSDDIWKNYYVNNEAEPYSEGSIKVYFFSQCLKKDIEVCPSIKSAIEKLKDFLKNISCFQSCEVELVFSKYGNRVKFCLEIYEQDSVTENVSKYIKKYFVLNPNEQKKEDKGYCDSLAFNQRIPIKTFKLLENKRNLEMITGFSYTFFSSDASVIVDRCRTEFNNLSAEIVKNLKNN